MFFFFFQAEDGIRDLVRSRGLGDVYKRQTVRRWSAPARCHRSDGSSMHRPAKRIERSAPACRCLLYTSDAADDLLCVDLGGRRITKKKKRRPPIVTNIL